MQFSELYEQKDAILSGLWEDYGVDSLEGAWDYVEPVLFGHAAGKAIEEWCDQFLVPAHRRAVVQAHEWMTASSLLYLKQRVPSAGTVFTTHATMLGRALSSLGHSPDDGLGDQTADELAREHNVVAKHSLEGVSAREADVFTTVSEITAKEAAAPPQPHAGLRNTQRHRPGRDRRPSPVTRPRQTVRRQLMSGGIAVPRARTSRMRPLLCISGRYEFHNKGIDLLLEALAQMNGREGQRVVLFVLVPAGQLRREERVHRTTRTTARAFDGPLGIAMHNLFDEENDAGALNHCAKVGLTNSPDARVKVIQVPIYLGARRTTSCNSRTRRCCARWTCPASPRTTSPWGYTPQESLAVGVPTVTTDYAGFGRWAESQKSSSRRMGSRS